jgi:hypothetical protein
VLRAAHSAPSAFIAELKRSAKKTMPATQIVDLHSSFMRKLLEDAPHIEEDFAAFKLSYEKLYQVDYEMRTIILQSHLVLEYHINKYLEAANPAAPNILSARLTFPQKLELADHPQVNFSFLISGMLAMNGLRNKIAHRLDYIPKKADWDPIRQCVQTWNTAAGKPIPASEIELLRVFTEMACVFLHGDTQAILRRGDGAGLIGLLNWWKNEKPS